jgi:hypothetical protein
MWQKNRQPELPYKVIIKVFLKDLLAHLDVNSWRVNVSTFQLRGHFSVSATLAQISNSTGPIEEHIFL